MRSTGALVAVLIAATAVACGGTPKKFSPAVFHGTANGVEMTLTVPRKPRSMLEPRPLPTLRLRFGSAADGVWRRALQARGLAAFCIWPEPSQNGGGLNIIEIHARPTHHRISVAVATQALAGSYTCGLHLDSRNPHEGWPWANYIRHALVSARLTRS